MAIASADVQPDNFGSDKHDHASDDKRPEGKRTYTLQYARAVRLDGSVQRQQLTACVRTLFIALLAVVVGS